jgi:hypothetical protein
MRYLIIIVPFLLSKVPSYYLTINSLISCELNGTSKEDILLSASLWLWRAFSTSSCHACICFPKAWQQEKQNKNYYISG